MDASKVVDRLLEAPEDLDDPAAIGSIPDYVAPEAFRAHVKDILEHARFLKEQAEQSGALALLSKFKPVDIDRAFLTIAVEQYNEELVAPRKIAQILNREMHSVWH